MLKVPKGKFLIILAATWGLYFLWLWPQMLYQTEEGIFTSWRTIWADWALHMGYATMFAERTLSEWFTGSLIFQGAPFHYHFVADLISGLLMWIGFSPVAAMILPSIVVTFVFLLFLFLFFQRVLKSPSIAYLAVTLFLMGGGLGFFYFFKDLTTHGFDAILFPPREYTHLPEWGIYWINVITSELLPQRPLLFGFAMMLGLLYVLAGWVEKSFQSYGKTALFGLFSALLMIVHMHSYLVLVLVCAVAFLLNPRSYRHWLTLGGVAAAVSMVLYSSFYMGVGESFIEFYPFWMANSNESKELGLVTLWWKNWGFFLPLALVGLLRLRLYKNIFVLTAIAIFIICNTFKFQPWVWDNQKIFTWSYLFFCIPVAAYLGHLWQIKGRLRRVSKLLVTVLVVLCCASGGLDALRLLRTDRLTLQMYSKQDVKLAEKLRAVSLPSEVVLASSKHNHFSLGLAGRTQLMGYKGWLWSHGINYKQRETEMISLFQKGTGSKEFFEKHNVSYLIIDNDLRKEFSLKKLLDGYPVVFEYSDVQCLKVSESSPSGESLEY